METKLLVAKAAKLIDVHPETLRRLERKGKIAAKRDCRGFRIFNLEELLKFKEARGELK